MNQRKKLQLVLLTVQETPESANDDALLMAKIWEKEGWDNSKSLYENLNHVSHPETITRRRRQAHQLGLIEYSKKADKERVEAFENERDSHSNYDFCKVKNLVPKELVESTQQDVPKISNTVSTGLRQVNIFSLDEK